jgi:flagellar hook capping protein FlgD
MRALVAVLLLCIVATASQAQTSFVVVNSGLTAYRIDGVLNPNLDLTRGHTYTFNVTATGHPFYIKTARVIGAGSQYTSGVTGQGVTNGDLTFVVPLDAPSTLFYQCGVHLAMGGTLNISGPVGVLDGGFPNVVWLGPATPNPAREGTMFRIGLPRDASIDFALYDLRGRKVRELAGGDLPAGDHLIPWDGRDGNGNRAPSGLYLYRFRVENRVLTGRIVMVR